jgi:Fic family protein
MSETSVDLHVLDAAYKPFPTFEEWTGKTFVDTVRWNRYESLLKEHTTGASEEVLARARNIAKRAAALDTGAIEGLYEVDRGFTYTVAVETSVWEAALAQKGEQVRSLFEAQLHAYDYVLDLATKAEPISEAAIRALHQEVCRAQATYRVMTAVGPQEQALPKGQYKALPNHVRTRKGTDHSYAPVDVTPAEMARLVSELRNPSFLAAHPLLQSTYAHYAFVVVHAFADGNGRVARALASAFTYRAISMPIVILSEHKDAYLDSLEAADSGNYQAFLDFMLARCLDTIELVDENVRAALSPSPEETLEAIKSLYVTRAGYTIDQVDDAAVQLLTEISNEFVSRFRAFKGPPVTTFITNQAGTPSISLPHGYRFHLSSGQICTVGFDSARPALASVRRGYTALVPKDPSSDDDIQVVSFAGTIISDKFTARIDELVPTMSGVLQIRIKMFVDRVIGELLAELKSKAQMAKMGG